MEKRKGGKTRKELVRFMKAHQAEVLREQERLIRGLKNTRYERMSPAEIKKTIRHIFQAEVEVLERNDWEKMDALLQGLARRRAGQGFSLSEPLLAIQNACHGIKKVLIRRLQVEERCPLCMEIANLCQRMIIRFADFFQAEVNRLDRISRRAVSSGG